MLILSVFTITVEVLAATPYPPINFSTAREARHNSLKQRLAAKSPVTNAPKQRLFNTVACVGNNNKPGILCSDGFCDTSPPNQCNGHGGISPGHQGNVDSDHVI